MTSDSDLLGQYARKNLQDAFTEIVRRHVDLVYSAALRQVRSPQLAEEVTQSVFTDLARSAGKLSNAAGGSPVLTAWLYVVTRRTAIDAVRTESRRQLREQIAVEMNNMNATANDWMQIAPLLDDAMTALDETDRAAVLLRYFENKSLHEVGATLGTSDDAAQKRVSRAVEKLREFFSKQKITIGASGLAVLISTNAVQSAPIGLAATISAAAILTGTAVSTSTVVATTKIIAMTTLQKSIIGVAFIAAVGTGIFEAHQNAKSQNQNRTLQKQSVLLAGQIQQLQRERDDATNQLAGSLAENAQLKSDSNENELLKLRSEVTQLHKGASDPTADAAKNWLTRVNQLKEWAEQNPAAEIPEFKLLTKQDWLNAARSDLNTDADYRRAMSSLRDTTENKVASMMHSALGKYIQANGGQFPSDLSQLQLYFDSPLDDAILQRWEIVPAKTIPNIGVGEPNIITEKSAVDDLLDTRMVIGARGYGNTDFLGTEIGDAVNPLRKAYGEAHGGNWTGFNNSNLLEYATRPEQKAAIQKLIEQQQLRSGQ